MHCGRAMQETGNVTRLYLIMAEEDDKDVGVVGTILMV